MQVDKKISVTYAEALLKLSVEQGGVEAVDDELREVSALLSSEGLWDFFRSPVITPDAKQGVMAKQLKSQLSETIYNFLGVLNVRRRLYALPDISREFSRLVDEELGRRHVYVYSAAEVDAEAKAALEQAIKGYLEKDVIMEYQLQADLIGGLVIRSEDLMLDTSVQKKLRLMKQRLLSEKIAGDTFYS